MTFYLNRFMSPVPVPHGTQVGFLDGTNAGYDFPSCVRLHWYGIRFLCDDGTWKLIDAHTLSINYSNFTFTITDNTKLSFEPADRSTAPPHRSSHPPR